ncbi:unannotated protein [freshwater metagenome]|uniref:Unannotated protein n=1 Tax=freshwater metagenome TaxID=449393 RepID=A0A6J7B187_9ZZZZ
MRLKPTSMYRASFSAVTESGLASKVISQSSANPLRLLIVEITRPKSSDGRSDGVPPPKNIVGTTPRGAASSSFTTASI